MESVQSFEEYLISKKIDNAKFKSAESDQYMALEKLFDQMNPKSFTQQKLFLINPLRLRFLLKDDPSVVPPKPKATFKPKIPK